MKKKFNKGLYFLTFICLIPLLMFGLYKNGYILYKKDYINTARAIKPLVLMLMSLSGAFLGTFIRERKVKDIKQILNKNKIIYLEAIIISFLMPINSSPIILFVVMFVMGKWFRTFEVNRIAVFFILIEVINKMLGLSSFLNLYEEYGEAVYNGFDLFLGFSTGGICSTSAMLILISLAVLSSNRLYKKEIALTSIIIYLIFTIVYYMATKNYEVIFNRLFGYNTLFTFVFVAPNLYSSSYTDKGKALMGLIIGVITFGLSFIFPYNNAILAVLITSLLKKQIDKPFLVKA